MPSQKESIISVYTEIVGPMERIWDFWTNPSDIVHWNNASDDWHTPQAENDLKIGGIFNYRMEARDGSMGFDFIGRYDSVEKYKRIAYTLEDGRRVVLNFTSNKGRVRIEEKFEPESENSVEMQQQGWQSILDNFKKYSENKLKNG